jgi:hypothetical protein
LVLKLLHLAQFLSLNYENGRFGPQTFASDSNSSLADSQIPFFTLLLPLRN